MHPKVSVFHGNVEFLRCFGICRGGDFSRWLVLEMFDSHFLADLVDGRHIMQWMTVAWLYIGVSEYILENWDICYKTTFWCFNHNLQHLQSSPDKLSPSNSWIRHEMASDITYERQWNHKHVPLRSRPTLVCSRNSRYIKSDVPFDRTCARRLEVGWHPGGSGRFGSLSPRRAASSPAW